MNKGFAWNWIITGLIIGLVVIGIFLGVLNNVFTERARHDADQQFSEIYARINTLCTASEGVGNLYKLNMVDIVEGLYASDNEKVFPLDYEDKVKNHKTFVGSELCMKLREEEINCRRLKCDVEMTYLGQKVTVMSLADKILKRASYTTYPVFISKNECGVSVVTDNTARTLADNGCVQNSCNYTVLMGCNRQATAVLVNEKAVVLGDSPLLCSGMGSISCTVPEPTIDFAVSIAGKFNGAKGKNKMLIIWEDKKMNPDDSTFDALIGNIVSLGIDVDTARHNSTDPNYPISSSYLNNYDQVWIFRPGWCYGEDNYGTIRMNSNPDGFCRGVEEWSDSEIGAIKQYVEDGGKIFLTSDYSSITDEKYRTANNIKQNINMPQDVAANKILAAIQNELYFEREGCYCGCGSSKSVTNYAKNPLVSGLKAKGYNFGGAAKIMC